MFSLLNIEMFVFFFGLVSSIKLVFSDAALLTAALLARAGHCQGRRLPGCGGLAVQISGSAFCCPALDPGGGGGHCGCGVGIGNGCG